MSDRWAEIEAKHDELRLLYRELRVIGAGPLYGCARKTDMTEEQVLKRIRELESELGTDELR